MFGDDGADVYLWEEGADVDGTDEHDGEVLSFASRFVKLIALCGMRHGAALFVASMERHWFGVNYFSWSSRVRCTYGEWDTLGSVASFSRLEARLRVYEECKVSFIRVL